MERRAEALRDEIGAMLEGELGDPRIGLATVSEVAVNPGGKSARVFIDVVGTDEEAEETLAGLNAAKGFVRSQLTERLGLRHCPELSFALDRKETYGGRIDQLLSRVEERKRRVTYKTGAKSAREKGNG